MSHSVVWQYTVENYWPCTVEPNVDLSVFLRELVFFPLFKTFLLLIMSQILAPFGEWCLNGLYTQRSFWGSTSQTLCAPAFSQGNQHAPPTPTTPLSLLPMLSQPDSCYVSMSSLFSLLLVPHLLSHRCSCHCLESAVRVKKRNKICPPSCRRNDARRSMLLLWPEIFPCRLHSWRRWLSQPRGLVTVTRTRFAVVLAQTFGVRLPWFRKETSVVRPLVCAVGC